MRNRYVLTAAMWLLICAAIIMFIIHDTPVFRAPQTPALSPSYWHWQDGVSPREDTIHYLTYEEAMPDEAQD